MPAPSGSPGSFDLSPIPTAIATTAMPVMVARYTPGGEDDEDPYTVLPNVRCLRIDYREGPEPPLARFQYYMDDLLAATTGWPAQFEQLWPIDAQGSYVVLNDDRLVVITQIPSTDGGDPQSIVLFDGFAQIPQVDVSSQRQEVTFVAQGVAIRLWDSPIVGRIQRDASNTDDTSGDSDIRVHLPCRFNPSDTTVGTDGGYIGNCVEDYTEDEDDDLTYPVFLDPLCSERGEGITTFWQVGDAVTYLIAAEGAPLDPGDNPYVIYPTLESLQDLLACYAPSGTGDENPDDVTETQIQIRDYDASNKAVPDAMAELLSYCGFVMSFFTNADSDGNPQTTLKITRKDALATSAPKLLYLAAAGSSSLDLAANNTTSLHLARDCNNVVNQWTMETALQQVEVSIYLAPGFTPSSGDAANPKPFQAAALTHASSGDRRMYRWWVADECGDGHYNMKSEEWVTGTFLDLSSVFPDDDNGTSTYCVRYRPGSHTLISKDTDGKPLKATLEIMTGLYSEDPSIGQVAGSGWVTIPHGWKLLDDRLGIEVTVPNPDDWSTGCTVSPDGTTAAVPKISAIRWTATPDDTTAFTLRLTTVLDADQRIGIPNTSTANAVTAQKRIASPTQFTRERSADGKDHFQYCTIDPGSLYYATQTDAGGEMGDGTNPLVCRDDTKAALTHAEQLRSAHEFPTLAGSATLPFLTDYYQIGDRVQIVEGRNANLQINVGTDQGETPVYPWITAFAWDFQGDKQQTILQFSDRRAEPHGV